MVVWRLVAFKTPLLGVMKKNKTTPIKVTKNLPHGRVLLELVVWNFTQDEILIRHTADELSKAIQMHFHLNNFGVEAFGLSDDE
jgi:hypothetical protein